MYKYNIVHKCLRVILEPPLLVIYKEVMLRF